jgi:hypothetical protein
MKKTDERVAIDQKALDVLQSANFSIGIEGYYVEVWRALRYGVLRIWATYPPRYSAQWPTTATSTRPKSPPS